eukprot:8129676-Alexandrium_andersonii.AAC.1
MVRELRVPAGVQHAGGGAGLIHDSPVQLGRGPAVQTASSGPVRAHGHQPAAGRPAVDHRGNRGIPVIPRVAE